jgi:alcohol dehydrogenase class IV
MHVPVATVAAAVEHAEELSADCTVAIGGGSTIGLAKALSLRVGLPSLVVPTTYAGSEVTPIWGLTENGVKTTGRDRKVLPKVVVYDPDLSMSLPSSMSVASGLNAIAHAMEGLYAIDGNPIVALMARIV